MNKHVTYFRFVFISRAAGLCHWFAVLCALWLAIPFLLRGESLDDFKRAADNRAVDSIPFSSLRSEASSLSTDVENRKGTLAGFNSNVLEKEKDNLLKDLKTLKDKIQANENEIKDRRSKAAQTAQTNPFIAELEDKNKKLQQQIDELRNGDIKKKDEKITQGIAAFGAFSEARARLAKKFDEVLSQLSNAKSNPEKYLGAVPQTMPSPT